MKLQSSVMIHTRYKEEIFYCKSGEMVEHIAQGGGRCPIPVKVRLDGDLSDLS